MTFLKRIFIFVIALVVMLAVALWILPAPLIKWGIETYGSKAAGGKIDVGSVDFSWFPAHVAIHQLQVTNPSEPMTNAVAINTLSTALNVPQLLDGKVYINELRVEGVSLDTPRKTSGALPGVPVTKSTGGGGFSLPALGLPDPNTVVDKEKALYEKKINDFTAQLQQRKEGWQKAVDSMPTQAQLNDYKKRWEEARRGNVLQKLQAAGSIRKDLQKDIDSIKSTRDQLRTQYAQTQSDYQNLQRLSHSSLDQVIQELGLSDSMLASVGQNLVNGKVKQWLDMGYGYYQLLAGSDKKGGAESAAATSAAPKTSPDFLIKLTRISGPFAEGGRVGQIDGEIRNISEAPSLYPEPIKLNLKASGKELGNIVITGDLDHRKPGAEQDNLVLKVADSMLSQFVLSQSERLGLTLDKAKLNLDASASLTKLADLNLNLDALFKQLAVSASGGDAGSDTAKAITSAIDGMSALSIKGKATGAIQNPKLALKSNLDGVLKDALSGVLKSKVDGFKAQLQPKLDAALQDKLGPVKDQVAQLGGFSKQADGRLADFENLLKGLK